MKQLSLLTLIAVFLCLCSKINAQIGANQYADRSYLIRFDPSATESEIEVVMYEMNSVELWVSPLTQTRLWELNGDTEFPYLNTTLGIEILDINEQREGAIGRPKVNEVDFNFYYLVDPTNSNNSGGPQNFCYQGISQGSRDESNIKVAILDTGFGASAHGISPTSAWNYVDGNDNVLDDNGHGTHIFSIIESTYFENTGIGPNTISWDIRKTHNAEGKAELGNIILALEEAVADGANIINLSTSYYDTDNVEQQAMIQNAIEVIEQNNVLVVASAGNEASELDLSHVPNCFPSEFDSYNLLTVGAYDCETDALSSFSNYGTASIDLVAPGNNIVGYEGKYFTPVYKSGTSQATAIVTGVAAILANNQNVFDYVEVKCAILSGVDHKSNLGDKVLSGGFLNAEKALEFLTNGCSEIIDTPLGPSIRGSIRRNEEINDANIYPNPASNLLTIEFNKDQSSANIEILNIEGRLMFKKAFSKIKKINIDISEFSNGMYFIRYGNANEITNNTFIKH